MNMLSVLTARCLVAFSRLLHRTPVNGGAVSSASRATSDRAAARAWASSVSPALVP